MQSGLKITSLTDLDLETTAYWSEVASALGFPRSLGEIYGLIFLSNDPLNADEIVQKTGTSRSGVGQALKTLSDIGAIRPSHQPQSRKEHYELQTDLSVLVRLFLSSRVLPRLEELSRRRAALAEDARVNGPAHLIARFEKLERWRTKTNPILATLKSLAAE